MENNENYRYENAKEVNKENNETSSSDEAQMIRQQISMIFQTAMRK